MNRARLQKRRDRDTLIKNLAVEEFERNKHDPLFLSGTVLYWAEGTRLNKNYRKYQLALTNSDSKLIKFYCNFLERYFENIDKTSWRVGLYLYPDINKNMVKAYWAQKIGITQKQFIKPQVLPVKNMNSKKLRHGICCVYVNSKDACLAMDTWIQAIGNMRR